jgi:hypothetical protein
VSLIDHVDDQRRADAGAAVVAAGEPAIVSRHLHPWPRPALRPRRIAAALIDAVRDPGARAEAEHVDAHRAGDRESPRRPSRKTAMFV